LRLAIALTVELQLQPTVQLTRNRNRAVHLLSQPLFNCTNTLLSLSNFVSWYQVKQILAIFLLVVYTCTGTTLQQLQKAPVLAAHYLEHRMLTPDISLAQYLVLHYLSGNVKDADYDRDMQLPFKKTDVVASATTPLLIPASFPELDFTLPPSAHVHGAALDEGFHSSLFLSSVWQPPRSC